MTWLDVAILTVGLGASGWCVWHCVRAMHATRQGKTASCCTATTSETPQTQLAALRAELDQLRKDDHHDAAVTTPR